MSTFLTAEQESLADAMRARLEATWCVAESGLAGPTAGRSGTPPGHTTIALRFLRDASLHAAAATRAG